MARYTTIVKKPSLLLKKLRFLIGKWHTSGEILIGATGESKIIRGTDTYEWISNGFFILHQVDVFMGNERTQAMEIIGYDNQSKSYFMTSFNGNGSVITMKATIEKPGVLKFGDELMRSVLTANLESSTMHATWELLGDGKKWKPWMRLHFDK